MRSKRLKINFIASVLNKLLIFSEHMALVPLYLKFWGVDAYGNWLSLIAIPTFLVIFNMGIGPAASSQIILYIGERQIRRAKDLLISSIIFMLTINIFIVTILYFGLSFFSIVDLNNIHNQNIILIIYLSLCFIAITEPFNGFWVSEKKAAYCLMFRNFHLIIKIIGIFLLINIGANEIKIALFLLILSVVWTIFYIWLTKNKVSYLKKIEYKNFFILSCLKKGFGYFLSHFWQALFFSGSILIAGNYLGPMAVATWASIRTMSRSLTQVLSIINQTFISEFQRDISHKKIKSAQNMFSLSICISLVFAILFAILLSIFGPWIFKLWTLNKLSVPNWSFFIVSLAMPFQAIWISSEMIHRAFNKPWYINLVATFLSLSSIIFMYISAKFFKNIEFFIFCILFFDFLMAYFLLKKSLHYLNYNFFSLFKELKNKYYLLKS